MAEASTYVGSYCGTAWRSSVIEGETKGSGVGRGSRIKQVHHDRPWPRDPKSFGRSLLRPIDDPCNSTRIPGPCTGEAKMGIRRQVRHHILGRYLSGSDFHERTEDLSLQRSPL